MGKQEQVSTFKPRKVLYIEDDPVNVDLVRRLLQVCGCATLEVASTGRAGVALAEEQLPDLVIVDLNLPDVDGYEVMAALQQDRRTAAIPIIVLTADTLRRADESRHLGAVAHFTKPFRLPELRAAVDESLGWSGTGPSSLDRERDGASSEPLSLWPRPRPRG